ncbi:MAG: SpoIIE family protein phosphatase [Bacteroidales bacterium]|nr:SpoIIE family protein phosphatase [Bacteroidales bacterium]MCF8391968.1 SpoIIE family protein phosphatase [Bacteroidales bacterium]
MSPSPEKKNRRLLMSNFKLNALLEITIAINENPSIENLMKKYEKFLSEDLEIGKHLIIKKNENWDCMLNSGFELESCNKLIGNKDLLEVKEISRIGVDTPDFMPYADYVIPVIHNEEPIAFVILGDIEEEGEGLSPIVRHLRFIQTLSNIIIVAIENVRLYNESLLQVALKREMELASRMQTMLIPDHDSLPSTENIRFYAYYNPHFDVGGDYYDVIKLSEDEVGFCMADVSGKGISAAILMSNFQANLRALFTKKIKLTKLVSILNERVLSSANGEKFITLFLAKYNYNTKELKYINAGHNPPLLYDTKKKKLSLLKSGCVGMGMLDELPFVNLETIRVDSRTKLFTYTDGLVELLEDDNVEWGTKFIEERISNSESIEKNIALIIKEQGIDNGNTAIFDDISILGVEFN